jgi:large subunit ribosomal protein L4
MKTEVFDEKGKKIEEITLEKKVFGQDVNTDLLAQYTHVKRTNARQGNVSTKTRAEVRGGGKKPWRQKGTGRARHGSIRSPIWVHGGIAHGPKPKQYGLSFPKKMRKTAMVSALSAKQKAGDLKVINEIKLSKPNTKKMYKMLKDLKLSGKTLFVLAKKDDNFVKSIRNLPKTDSALADNLNPYQILNCKNLIVSQEAVKFLQERYK